jgi:hypothetical protein
VIPAEFEEKTYESPLYGQLERANPFVYSPGQVLENSVGFDAGLRATNMVLWQTVGYSAPPDGTLLASIAWPAGWGPHNPKSAFPDVRLNLFLQAKRPFYHKTKPRLLKTLDGVNTPLWAFDIVEHQQKLLQVLAEKTQGTAHVAYASAVFHTNAALFAHMKGGTIVENSTFPSAMALQGHDKWYYWSPGAAGAANPNPEIIQEAPFLDRIRTLARQAKRYERDDLSWLDVTARNVIEVAYTSEGPLDAVGAHFSDDLLRLNRLADQFELRPSLRAYAQIGLFTARFDLRWLVVTGV